MADITLFTHSRTINHTGHRRKMFRYVVDHFGPPNNGLIVETQGRYAHKDIWLEKYPTDIQSCRRLVFCTDKDGYIGRGVFTEIGYALALGKPVFYVGLDGHLYTYRNLKIELWPGNWEVHAQVHVIGRPFKMLIDGVSVPRQAVKSETGKTLEDPRKRLTPFWRTKDGRRIRVQDMEDSHVVNTLALLDRHGLAQYLELYQALMGKNAAKQYHIAQEIFTERLGRLLPSRSVGSIVQGVLRVPVYRALLLEVKRRCLERKVERRTGFWDRVSRLNVDRDYLNRVMGDIPDEAWDDIPW